MINGWGGAGVGEKLERFLDDNVTKCTRKRATQLIGQRTILYKIRK